MPSLHRMPVAYAAVLGLAVIIGFARWNGAAGPVAPAPIEPSKPAAQLDTQVRHAEAAKVERATVVDAVLRTADGLRRKVVIKDLGVVRRTKPKGGIEVGPVLDYFAIRFLFGEAPADHPAMVEIGTSQGQDRGWVPSEAVLEWDTRLMAKPAPRAGRPPLVLYHERECLLDALAGKLCPRHRGKCPTEGEESSSNVAATALGMPILQSQAIVLPDGTASAILQVASLVRDQAAWRPPAALPDEILSLLRTVEIAFVIDTTASMQSTIDAARRLAAQLVQIASKKRDVTLRLGLVEYRDTSPASDFSSRIVTGFTDPGRFLDALGRVAAARRGDGTIDEAVLDAVARTLPGDRTDPAQLGWSSGRAGELSTKMLVLLGDAPDHATDLVRARRLASRARAAGISIATVTLDRPGSLSRGERERYRAQWLALAEGSFRPLAKGAGFKDPIAPLFIDLDQADRLVPALQAIIDDRIEHARARAELAAAQAEGRLQDYVNRQGLTLERVAPVLVDLHRDGRSGEARPDPRLNGRKAPSVRRGWIAERQAITPMVTLEILMSRAELDALIDELTQLQQAAEGNSREVSDLLRIGNAAATGEAGFLAADRGSVTFAEHLRKRRGLPPARADSLLQRSQVDLLQSDDAYREALEARLSSCITSLIRRRNDPDWIDPGRTIDGMALVPYGLFDF